MREAGNLSVAMETDPGQRLSPEGIETLDGSLVLRVASSHSICPGGSTEVGEVDCGIGTISHATVLDSKSRQKILLMYFHSKRIKNTTLFLAKFNSWPILKLGFIN